MGAVHEFGFWPFGVSFLRTNRQVYRETKIFASKYPKKNAFKNSHEEVFRNFMVCLILPKSSVSGDTCIASFSFLAFVSV